jgi:hypothetical protein
VARDRVVAVEIAVSSTGTEAEGRTIAARVEQFADRPSVASTTPERSLAEAKAAGWKLV